MLIDLTLLLFPLHELKLFGFVLALLIKDCPNSIDANVKFSRVNGRTLNLQIYTHLPSSSSTDIHLTTITHLN